MAAVAGLVTLGGCMHRAEQGPCPAAGILKNAELYPVASGEGAGGPYRAELTGVDLTCKYRGKKPVRASLSLTFAVTAPEGAEFEAVLPYFVAVTRDEEAILGRERFSVKVPVRGGSGSATDKVAGIEIPLAPGTNGSAYQVLAGFELTPAQLERNRKGPQIPK